MGGYGGYMGKALRVDLSSGSVEAEDLDWEVAAKYIGGRGYAAKLLYDALPKGIDPLSPENVLIFATGPVTGLPAPTSGRFSISSKSPLTGTIMDSNCGGYIGVELKRAGFDAVIVEGSSPSPVYLLIRNGEAKLRPAEHLWGKLVDETQGRIRSEVGEDGLRVASIGPAGENRVRIASIMADVHRAAGRGGLGAVMGSKNLKAIAALGDGRIEPANGYAFLREVKAVNEVLSRNPLTGDTLGRYGTASLVHIINRAGILPTRNFQEGTFEEAESVSGEAISKGLLVRKKGCFACPIMCGRVTRIRGAGGEVTSEGPEYETVWSLGPNCGISDIGRIALINHMCNLYGLDTISFGNAIGFLMEARERGLLELEDPDLRWGNHEAVEKMVGLTAERKGIGELASEGVKRASERIGGKEFAMHVKGMELPAYDPRGAKGQGLAYATSNRGGCHLRAYMIESEILSLPRYLDPLKGEGKAGLVKRMQDVFAVLDSMIVCKYTTLALFKTLDYEPYFYARLLTTATGFYFDEEEFRRAGERIYNIERLFNAREGFGRAEDALPPRLSEARMPSGPAEGQTIAIGPMLDEYYAIRGWMPSGVPSDKKLQELGITSQPTWPKLQVALDLRDLEEAIRIAELSHRGGAEWLEAGTPLVKSAGMRAVSELRRRFPAATVVADLKTLDTGWLETEIAVLAGADVVSISGLASDNTIRDSVGCAKKYGAKVMVDLLEVKDPVKRAKEIEALGADYICAHSAIDVQRDRDQEVDRKVSLIADLARSLSIPLAVAGGIRYDTARKLARAGAKIIIVGAAVTRAADPMMAARRIAESIRS